MVNLKYWNVDLQEIYSGPDVALKDTKKSMRFNYFFIIKLLILYFILFGNSNAQFRYDLPERVLQGEIIISKIHEYNESSNIQLFSDKIPHEISKNGYFVVPIDRDRKNNILIEICKNKICKTNEITVLKRNFDIQEINGLLPNLLLLMKKF